MDFIIHLLDLIGTAVFAITGALAAGRKRMDVFGVVVLGCVTAIGGGTLRDLILGSRPVFWIEDTMYLAIPVATAIGTFVVARSRRLPEIVILYADAVGLAVFTAIGFQKGFQVTNMYSIAIVMGMSTGVAGGIIRDVLSGEVPLIFHREIYASASLCGGVLLALLTHLQQPSLFAVSASIMTTLAIRVAALHWNLTLPRFLLEEDRIKATRNEQNAPEDVI
ncbi:Uncharacterized membrane protein YeiH [Desulfuromusa kysingii]|uniref:Uncharacterized membrane protein YeiH n=1 Tax=Desulfuromusa kysingii TaxID=37625 RepID=A0A1H4DSQ8_9BACT|nr:trimeric intracellular cation channel family protein [Desulfuromusa kysingii]SEA75784.1 Uncharacterized membrane protein YeiH [Desulfuromusa kysingii]